MLTYQSHSIAHKVLTRCPKVYVVLVNYNSWEDTVECVKSLLLSSYENFQILIVDNNSTNNSIQEIGKWLKNNRSSGCDLNYKAEKHQLNFAATNTFLESFRTNSSPIGRDVVFLSSKKNLGFAGGNNVGLEYIHRKDDADYVWILNNDTVVKNDSIEKQVNYTEKNLDKRIGVLGSKVLYYHDPRFIQCIGGSSYNRWTGYSKQIGNRELDNGQYDVTKVKPDLIIGASMLITKEFLKIINYFDENYFLYFEEQDIAKLAFCNKFSLDYAIESVVYHKEGRTIGAGKVQGKTTFSDFYYNRSKILFTYKYYGYINRITIRSSILITIIRRAMAGKLDHIVMLTRLMMMPIHDLRKSNYEKLYNK